MFLVVEVMQQRRGRVELQKLLTRFAGKPLPVRLRRAAGRHANLYRARVFAQAVALRPLGEQPPRLFAPVLRRAVRVHKFLPPSCCLWFVILWVFPGMMEKS